MTIELHKNKSVDGYPRVGSFKIIYNFRSGIQGKEHYHPGVRYDGTQRECFLPANSRGIEVLAMLKIAWERRLIFTIDKSETTQKENQIVWNGIHHKTSPTDDGGFDANGKPIYIRNAFPDMNYLDNVTLELASMGVRPSDIKGMNITKRTTLDGMKTEGDDEAFQLVSDAAK
ncbi:hypothetical protein [Endozoicomonas elysicola]|uniref:RING-type E3 ubiquitin transferase n=1 Tax=Endozoicomonas elysicola TaxID=305900 RepID=A0A081K734_9GAMM|nr:hypothetical protein [Endozoicomonas elysicola]KEI69960.1 hypothetical protein GV64_03655 [Endozoicomonas elysicola]